MKTRDLPLHVFHFDCFWMRDYHWCDFEWDPRTFPDPVGMLKRLHERGLRICLWINPYIAQRSPLFKEGKENGYLLMRTDGNVFQDDLWQPGMAIVDFTNPAASDWYCSYLRRLLDMGVDCFKTDFGERIPTEGVVWHDGSDPEGMHNLFSVTYNEAVFKTHRGGAWQREKPCSLRGLLTLPVSASRCIGVGDCWSSFESMAESLRGGLSLNLSGFGFWSHDIGGFEGNGSPEVYKRWIAFGLLSSHSRLHGNSSYRIPWAYDEEACDVLRKFTKLKCTLMPYLFAKAVEACETGCPMLRAMMLEFPEDPASDTLDRQYMLGDSLLVAPVMTSDGSVSYYLPKGTWTHLLTGETQEGGAWFKDQYDFLGLPLFVRPGTILPIGSCDDRPDYDFSDDVLFRLYALAEGAKATCNIPALDGSIVRSLTATRKDGKLKLELSGTHTGAWRIQLVGMDAVQSVEGASLLETAEGLVLVPNKDARVLSIQL
jgi:alpha-D-xyloside xylohydrolase